MHAPRLLDETGRPGLRTVWGRLLSRAATVDVAVTHVRLATLGLGDAELERVRRLRVLVAELSAAALDAEARVLWARPASAEGLARLVALLDDGRLAVRSAPLGGWEPDFSVFHGPSGPRVALVGSHRFDAGGPLQGPFFVSAHGRRAASRAALRFRELWARGHDVRTPVGDILRRARREAGVAPPRTAETVVPHRLSRGGRVPRAP